MPDEIQRDSEYPLVVEKSAASEFDARFILSAASPDRVKDSIAPAAYAPLVGKRYPAHLEHRRGTDGVIGFWDNLKTVGDTLVGDIKFTTTALGKTVKTWLTEGVPLFASIGFRGKGTVKSDGGLHFTQLDLTEVSLTTVPAHPRAVEIAKSFGLSLDAAGHLSESARSASSSIAAPAARNPQRRKSMAKSISELVVETQAAQVATRDKLTAETTKLGEITDLASDEYTTQKALVDQLDGELKTIDEKLTTLKSAEERLSKGAAAAASAAIIAARQSSKDTENLLGKLALVTYQARVKSMTFEQVVAERFPGSQAVDTMVKAAQNPAMSNVPGYAQELTRQAYGQLMEMLRAEALLPRLVPQGQSHSFEGGAPIVVPMRAGTPTDAAAAFRAEGAPIRVGGLQFTSQSLTPKNMGVILTATEEMLRRSTIDLTSYFENAMKQDTAFALDTLFLSNTAGTATSPAGARAALAAGDTRASTGATATAITNDLKVMLKAMTAAFMGSTNTRWLMHPSNLVALSFMLTATGAKQFPETAQGQLAGYPVVTSMMMPTNIVLLIDFAQFSFAIGNPNFLATNVATLHEEDTTPLPLASPGTPTTAAAPQRSLYQTYSWALRMVLDADWQKMRTPGPVQELTAVAW